MNARRGDIVAGMVAAGLVAFVFVASEEMPDGPAGFPRLIAIGLLICSVILIGRAILIKKDSPILFTDIHWPTILLLAGVWIGVIFLVESLGFLIPGIVFVGLTAWYLLGRPTGAKVLVRLVAFVIGVSFVLWVVFHKLLGVESPSGFFF
jgi:Tripartite tricarboxylate transporter TctB family